MKHFNITIKGKVHGVSFRISAKQEASLLGVNGFVCNRPDGSVYIEAEGTEAALSSFIKWCRRGSSLAVVKEIIVEEQEVRNFSGFEKT
jgi:acylphosphatase